MGAGQLASRPQQWGRRFARPEAAVLLATVAVVAYFGITPVAYLLWGAFFDSHGATLGHFEHAYSAYGLGEMVRNSLWFATGSTVVGVVLGATLAFLVMRTDAPFRRIAVAGAFVPLLVPGVLYAVAWIFLAGPRIGALNDFLPITLDIYSMGGMILVEGLHLSPLVFLLMAAAFRSMDPALEEAALASGARPATAVRRVTLPLLKPAIAGSILVTMVRALEAFEVPAMIGIPSGTWVFTSRIWRSIEQVPSDLGAAGAYSCSLLVLVGLGVFLYSRFAGGTGYETIAGRGFRPRRMELGRWRAGAGAVTLGYALVAAGLPLFVLLYGSLRPNYSSPSLSGLSHLTLDHYSHALSGESSLRGFRNSLVLGLGTATAVMLVMAVAAWLVVRTRVRGRWLLDGVASLPLVVPGLVLGVALLFIYLRSPVPVYGTLLILFFAYFTRFMPHGIRFASVSMQQLGGELEEAARTSGASWGQSFRRVVLPLAAPGLAAGWIYVFILSMRELSTSVLLYSPGTEVVPVQIWREFSDGRLEAAAAEGMLLMLLLVLLAAIGALFARRAKLA